GRARGFLGFGLAVAGVGEEGSRRRELAELVTDHIFADEHRNKFSAVVHADREPDHFWHDRRAARPGADHLPLARFAYRRDFFDQMRIDKRAFFNGARHRLPALSALNDILVGRMILARLVTFGRLAPGRHRMIALGAPLAAAVGMVDWIL